MESLNPELLAVLHHAHHSPFSTKSDFARQHTDLIAEAACRGLVTTLNPLSISWGRQWLITALGLRLLENSSNE